MEMRRTIQSIRVPRSPTPCSRFSTTTESTSRKLDLLRRKCGCAELSRFKGSRTPCATAGSFMLMAAILALLALALVPLAVYVLVKRPQLFLILVIPSQVLLGGAERGSVVTGLRAGELALAIDRKSVV